MIGSQSVHKDPAGGWLKGLWLRLQGACFGMMPLENDCVSPLLCRVFEIEIPPWKPKAGFQRGFLLQR